MTSDTAIRVDHLSKLYRIGRAQQRHDTLRDALTTVFRRQASSIRRQETGQGPPGVLIPAH